MNEFSKIGRLGLLSAAIAIFYIFCFALEISAQESQKEVPSKPLQSQGASQPTAITSSAAPTSSVATTSTPFLEIKKVTPDTLYIERGKMEETCIIIEGTNLQQVRKALVYRDGKPYLPVFARFIPTASTSKKIAFLVAPNAELDGRYQIFLLTQNKKMVALPLRLHIVTPGDQRAQTHLKESAKIPSINPTTPSAPAKPKSLQLDLSAAPSIERTKPSPLILPADGSEFPVLIEGKNLDKITQLRIRPANQSPRYRGDEGLIPFQKEDGGTSLSFYLKAPNERPSSISTISSYTLDLIMDRYLAASLSVQIGSTSTHQSPSDPPSTGEGSQGYESYTSQSASEGEYETTESVNHSNPNSSSHFQNEEPSSPKPRTLKIRSGR